MPGLRPAFFSSLLLVLVGACAAGEYAIQLERPSKAGETFALTGRTETAERRTTKNADGIVQNDFKRTLEYTVEAQVKVLTVDEKGRVLKQELTLGKLQKREHGRGEFLDLLSGTVLQDRSAEEIKYTQNDKPLPPDQHKACVLLFGSSTAQRHSDDALFGSAKPQATGATWALDAAVWKDYLQPTNLTEFSGTAKIEAAPVQGGVECLTYTGSITLNKFQPALPPGAVWISGTMTINAQGLLPVDLNRPRLTEELRMSMQMLFKPAGTTDTVEVHLEQKKELKRTTP